MNNTFRIKGLNGLRAIASMTVVIGHIELIKMDSGLENSFYIFKNWGSLGVNLFFVLSGFLITTLLLIEKEKTGSINRKNFYIRRSLRILPLYFSILISTIFIFNYSPSWITLILCASIFPNIAHAFSLGWFYSPNLWSIGVEEQFYLFWPSILKRKLKSIIIICLFFIFVYPLLPHLIQFVLNQLHFSKENLNLVEKIYNVLNFNSMATGALISILYYQRNFLINKLLTFSPILNVFLVTLPFILWFSNVNFGFFQVSIYSGLFAWMIILIVNGTLTRFFEAKILIFLGQISYGIYMYHYIILLMLMKFIHPYFDNYSITANIVLYVLVILLTILLSYISYHFFEKNILKLKIKFT